MKKKAIIPIVVVAGVLVSYAGVKILTTPKSLDANATRTINASKSKNMPESKSESKSKNIPKSKDKSMEPKPKTTPEPVIEPVPEPTTTPKSEPVAIAPELDITPPAATTTTTSPIAGISGITATTQYSHTENGHQQGQVYTINATKPTISKEKNDTIIRGQASRGNIGREKGTIIIDYQLVFNDKGQYQSGNVTSTGYVTPSITLTPGQGYIGQTINAITTTEGRAISKSIVYPINISMTLN